MIVYAQKQSSTMLSENNFPGITNTNDRMIEDLTNAFIRKEMCDLVVKCGDKELELWHIAIAISISFQKQRIQHKVSIPSVPY